MMFVLDRDSNVINKSKNLAGVRRYMALTRSPVKHIDLSHIGQSEGQLSILWENNASFQTNFASFTVMQNFVDRWRNAWGAPLSIDGLIVGTVHGR